MQRLALVFLILAPIASLQFSLGGPRVAWAFLVSLALAAGAIFHFISGNWKLPERPMLWLSPFVAFLAIGMFSLVTGPYGGVALTKALVQVAAIVAMLLTILALAGLARENRAFMIDMLRWTFMTLGVIGLIAVFQFLVNNITRMELVQFNVFGLLGGSTAWYSPGMIGGLYRANSIEPEPAHMTTYLALGASLAVMRLGGLGPSLRGLPLVCAVMPVWAATGIVAGFAVSVSLMGYIGILAAWGAAALIWFALRPRKARTTAMRRSERKRFYIMAMVVVAAVAAIPFFIGGTLFEKLSTISLIYDNPGASSDGGVGSGGSELDDFNSGAVLAQNLTANLSALALAVNANVMVTNLRMRPSLGVGIGAHPNSYDDNFPAYARVIPGLTGLNRDEAGSLMFRLLSETGLAGTLMFLAGCAWACMVGVRAIRVCRRVPGGGEIAPVLAAILASWVTILMLYLTRFGGYFSPVFWTSLAFLIITSDWVLEAQGERRTVPNPAPSATAASGPA